MKKSLLALAVLGAFAGVASAQSSVTLFGTVDVSAQVRQERRPAPRRSAKQPTASTAAELGFRGIEDLGGGLKAGFNHAVAGVNPDTGTDRNAQVLQPPFDGQPVQQLG